MAQRTILERSALARPAEAQVRFDVIESGCPRSTPSPAVLKPQQHVAHGIEVGANRAEMVLQFQIFRRSLALRQDAVG